MSRDLHLRTLLPQENGSSPIQFASGQSPGAGETAVPGGAEGAGAPAGGSPWSFWLMLLLLFGFMWFFVIRPESKRRKAQQSFHSGLKKGDEVVTIGGMHGSIVSIEGNVVTLKVAEALRLKFDRNAIARAASAEEAAAPAK
jgi:preprotein translocase subunit YajC